MEKINRALPKDVQVIEPLEQGGQAVVFKGIVNGSHAAIKLYAKGQIEKRIQREVEALKRFDCPNIVKLLWAEEVSIDDEPRQIVATELIIGKPLSAIIGNRKITNSEMTSILHGVVNAIDCMWAFRIVHRDIKPSNIMLGENGNIYVIDLGVARHLDQTSLTALGATWGTLGYFSPEQTRGVRQLTCKSDLYALGIVLIEVWIGKHPSNGDQLRLLSESFHLRLPGDLDKWQYSNILKRILDPQPTKRPLPSEILESLPQNGASRRGSL